MAKGEVTEKMARMILEEMFEKGVSPEAVIESKGLKPIQDSGTLEKIVDEGSDARHWRWQLLPFAPSLSL
jgi:Asp-tRNA(Asn)/Glu-tRNA(Gln) amidotransferase B subunit